MPHLRLEYSENMREKVDLKTLFSLCHGVLVKTLKADLFRCQSRAICCEDFYVGDGSSQEAFIYLELLLLEGRSFSQLEEGGKELLKILQNCFSQSNVQIAVRIVEFSSERYFKVEMRS